MKRLISLAFVLFGLSFLPLDAEEVGGDSLYWLDAEQKMERGDYEEAAKEYSKLIERSDSLFRTCTVDRVEDMRKKYSIDELEWQANRQQTRLWELIFGVLLFLLSLLLGGLIYLGRERRKLIKSRNQYQEAKTLAEESIRNKSLFLSNMSHEIRTPLNAVAGFSELLTTQELAEVTRAQCNDVIHLNSNLLINLIGDVVDISCLDITNMKFDVGSHEVVALCRNVVRMLGNIKQTSAVIDFKTEVPMLTIETDLCRLQQILINLLVNATKFTKEGSITLALKVNECGWAEFSVMDTGCGIPVEKQKAIFGRFEKLHEGVQGTGLGLSICKLIINRLGGDIWVDQAYTGGARLVFTHPLTQEGRVVQ